MQSENGGKSWAALRWKLMLRDDAEFLIKWMHYVQLFWEQFF